MATALPTTSILESRHLASKGNTYDETMHLS